MTWNVIFFQIYIVIFALWTFLTLNFDFKKVVSIFTKVDLFLCSLSSMLKISRLHSNLTLISETKSGSNFLRKCQIIQINFWLSTHNAKGQEALFWGKSILLRFGRTCLQSEQFVRPTTWSQLLPAYGLSFIRAAGASNFWNSRLTSESCFLTSRLLNFSVIFSYSWKNKFKFSNFKSWTIYQTYF